MSFYYKTGPSITRDSRIFGIVTLEEQNKNLYTLSDTERLKPIPKTSSQSTSFSIASV